jgi:23S rRNA-intervening sequence protein
MRDMTEDRGPQPEYKFQRLDVYQLGMDFVDIVYGLTSQLPDSERFNLRSQLERAATSIVLNIAEGSTGQSDLEQHPGRLFCRSGPYSDRNYYDFVSHCCSMLGRSKKISRLVPLLTGVADSILVSSVKR